MVVNDGGLQIEKEGRVRKFCQRVMEKTFASASNNGRAIMYITERAVLQLRSSDSRLELLEIAPGIDLEKDVLGQMDFKPIMNSVKVMDARCFQP